MSTRPVAPPWSEELADAGFGELEDRGFRVGASDLSVDDLKAVFYAMLAAAGYDTEEEHNVR